MKEFAYNIYLIGFMGAGKSTIASCLHQNYRMEAVEMDALIEEREGKKISRIFEENGEEYFRQKETELLLELGEKKNTVISCGGGTPVRTCNVEAMKRSGRVVFLTAAPETVLERVKDSHDRPLIENNKNISFLTELMEKRRNAYEAAADICISTDGLSAEQICQVLVQELVKKFSICS